MTQRLSSQPRKTDGDASPSSPDAPDAGELPAGENIPGTRYRVLERIGRGGNGTVYAAEHVDLERKVALKLLSGALARTPGAVDQFRKEARAANRHEA